MSNLKRIEDQLIKAPNLKSALQLDFVQERFIANYKAVSGREDGESKFQSEMFAYMEIIHDNPDLAKAERFSHFAALIKCGYTGLSFRDNKLYVMPGKNNTIKVDTSPAGKREQMEMMKEILQAPEAQVVMKGDKFIHDKLNHRVTVHETTDNSQSKITLDNIVASYQEIQWKDGRIKHVVVYHDDLLKARAKSPAKSEQSFWATYPGEAAKKVSTKRAFRLYHKYPDNIVTFSKDIDKDEEEETKDIPHIEEQQPQSEEVKPVIKRDSELENFLNK